VAAGKIAIRPLNTLQCGRWKPYDQAGDRSKHDPRVADQELAKRLRTSGAVLIEGPKSCGKTETARRQAASEVLLDVDVRARTTAAIDPGLILDGEVPRLIDEWQVEPEVWNHVRRAVDERRDAGQFILAGSAVPADDATRHSGAGRISRLRMRPMSLFESGMSDGSISLSDLMNAGRPRSADRGIELADLTEALVRGGWPALQNLPVDDAIERTSDYLVEISRTDINQVDGVHRDPIRVRRLLGSLARNVATQVALTTLAADTAEGGEGPLKRHTVSEYLSALERLFVLENQPAWQPHLRSRSRLRSEPKRHFVDPSLAAAALGASPTALLRDLNLLGFLFESLVVRDLRVYSQPERGEVRQFRDNKGLELDAIVVYPDRWAAFEVKLGGEKAVDEASRSLLKFASEIDTKRSGAPEALGVIVAGGYGYVREDGVQVIPITSLGP
jgi:predicted AAA+ superfamily ATPase